MWLGSFLLIAVQISIYEKMHEDSPLKLLHTLDKIARGIQRKVERNELTRFPENSHLNEAKLATFECSYVVFPQHGSKVAGVEGNSIRADPRLVAPRRRRRGESDLPAVECRGMTW